MANGATPEARGWIGPALAIVGAVTAARIVLLWFNRMDLFVDEAQYWLWGQELAFGYYSKPPLIGWIIRAVTGIAGSDAPFWVRLPAPLLHGLTAMILGAVAARLSGRGAAIVVAAGYVTLPMVSLASILISTDTVMVPFLALALLFYLRLLDQGGTGLALLTGLALGAAFMGKYAAIYYLIGMGLAAAVLPRARMRRGEALALLAGFAVMIAPNIVWNIQNGLSTVEHTLDNADWVRDPEARAGLNLSSLAAFFASQFAVFGPVLFGGLIWMVLRVRRTGPDNRLLLHFILPIIAIVCVQALLSRAYANWAAAAYLAGTVAVLPWLRPGWRAASFVVNGALAVALPLAGVFADSFAPGGDGRLVAARYVGRAALSRELIALAREAGLDTIVATNRDILADLHYTGRDSGLAFRALPPKGRALHHYALKYPLDPEGTENVLFVTRGPAPDDCAAATVLGRIAPERGAYRGKTWLAYRVDATCLTP